MNLLVQFSLAKASLRLYKLLRKNINKNINCLEKYSKLESKMTNSFM